MSERQRLYELARLFLRLGITGFGGPAVHIAMMRDEVVRRRAWMSDEHFLDLVSATNLIPGPNSTEMSMHCGHERAGWKGLVVAGACFIVPAVLITGSFAWAYARYGARPAAAPFLYGIKAAVLVVVLAAVIPLARKAVKALPLALLCAACVVAVLLGVHELLVFFGAAALGVLLHFVRTARGLHGLLPLPLLQAGVTFVPGGNSWRLFWIFLKIGSLLYGSGYVLFAFLDAELVGRGLLTRQVLIDAVAVGQFTPGPVFSAATFIGFQIGGCWGAVAATVGIFLPSFLFVALLNPLIPRLRRSPVMAAFLDAANVASIGIIAAVLVNMGQATLTGWRPLLISIATGLLLLFFPRVNSALLVLLGALAGFLLALV